MTTYRLYCFDGLRKIVSADWIEAKDDEEAIELATQADNMTICELWEGYRLVVRLPLKA